MYLGQGSASDVLLTPDMCGRHYRDLRVVSMLQVKRVVRAKMRPLESVRHCLLLMLHYV